MWDRLILGGSARMLPDPYMPVKQACGILPKTQAAAEAESWDIDIEKMAV